MRGIWKFALIALCGVCVGVGLDQSWHAFRAKKGAEIFQQRLRCRRLADEYEKKESSDFNFLSIDQVDFSPARNSCVATTLPRGNLQVRVCL